MDGKKIKNFLVDKNASIKKAIRIIDQGGLGIVFVIDEKKRLFGVVADSDIRRAILEGMNIEKPVKIVANIKPIVLHEKFKEKDILEMKKNSEVKKRTPIKGSLKIPVIDDKKRVKDIFFLYANGQKTTFLSKNEPKYNHKTIKKGGVSLKLWDLGG